MTLPLTMTPPPTPVPSVTMTALRQPLAADVYKRQVQKLDYECELAVVLGKDARDVPAGQTKDYVFGYTILNDVSARDVQTDMCIRDRDKVELGHTLGQHLVLRFFGVVPCAAVGNADDHVRIFICLCLLYTSRCV